MSLMICPDCGHEVSTAAVACANCGRPTHDPTIERNVVVTETPPPVRDDFPKWIFIPIAALGMVVLFLLFMWMRNTDEANVNVNVAARRGANNARETTPARTDTLNDPTTISPSSPSSIQTVPGESVTAESDRGTAVVEAKVATRSGGTQPVKNEKFYLLDKDLEDILDDAGIDDEGQGLTNAFGLSILYPNQYGETRSKALSAIAKHTKYTALTDASGKATIKDIKPGSYYLFGITKASNSFGIWSSQVTIATGENILNLSPVSLTQASR